MAAFGGNELVRLGRAGGIKNKEDKNMDFKNALEAMKHGEAVKLPSWGGF